VGLSAGVYTDRAISSNDVDWDLLVSLEVPVWDWTARGAAMDEAGAEVSQSENEFSLTLRQALLEVKNAHRDLATAKRQLAIRQSSAEYARQDYELQVQDDKQGLVTSLEVFESLDRLNTAELAYNRARLDEKLAVIKLRIACGSDPQEILQ
jgi:outer membrane protein TolC